MNGQQIIEYFQSIVDDSTLSEDTMLSLANQAKDVIEGERAWMFLRKRDSSQSTSPSDTYLTPKTLPTDFLYPIRVNVGADLSGRYIQIPFDTAFRYQSAPNRYYLDLANNQFFLTGTVSDVKPIYLFYTYQTPDITTTTSPTFPAKFHKLIGMKMAEMWWSIDQGERFRSWDDKWGKFYAELFNGMRYWDDMIQTKSREGVGPDDLEADASTIPNVVY
jgi:hypothetical protein